MRKFNFLHSAASCTLAAILVTAMPAMAQETDAAQDSETDTADMPGEIIVTATKRSESINKVSMSITAATGDQLIALGVTDTSQLAKVVPGFTFNETVYGAPVYTIRGVGFQESSLAASPTVSVYVDEVPIPFPSETLGASLDIERVEVLKGPQGTLYGQNSTGGAVNYIAAKPTDTFSFGANGTFGRFNMANVSGYVSGPLGDTVRTRLSARIQRGDGWQESISRPGDRLGSTNQLAGRLLTEWTPSDTLTLTLNVNGWRDKSESPALQLTALNPQDPTLPLPAYVTTGAIPAPDGKARLADWDPATSFKRDNSFYQFSLRGDLELNDAITLTSISSYQKYERDMPVDGDGTQFTIFRATETGQIETFFQELRLSGDMGDGNWMVGVNYQSDKTEDQHVLNFIDSSTGILGGVLINQNTQDIKTKAIYANFEYPIIGELKLQAAARYTDSSRDYTGCARDPGTPGGIADVLNFLIGVPLYTTGECITILASTGAPGVASKSLDEDNVSWRAGLSYQVDPGTLLYANVSKGYKAGSFPILSALVDTQLEPVVQESLLAYEAGFKARLGSFAQINGAVFYYDYQDKQIRGLTTTFLGLGETLINVPKSHVFGFELSGTLRPVTGLTISPSITLVDSEIDGNFTNFDGFAQPVLLSGQPFPSTPRWQGNTDVDYRFALSDSLGGFFGANVQYQSHTNGLLGLNSEFHVPSFVTLDLRAGVEDPSGRWSVGVWGRNVTDKFYLTNAVRSNDTLVRSAAMPATYGVSFNFKY